MTEKLIAAMQMSTPIAMLITGLIGTVSLLILALVNEKVWLALLAMPLLWATITLFGAMVM